MQTPNASFIFAGVLALSVSLPAAAAEKVIGVNKDFQRLSETTVNVSDKPDHTFKQNTTVWKTVSSNPNFGEAWTSAVSQQDNIGPDTTERGYGTNHYQNGDVNYFSWEGTAKTTKKDEGDFETAAKVSLLGWRNGQVQDHQGVGDLHMQVHA